MSSRDLAATERFYVDLMGFKVVHEFRNPAGERYGFFLYTGGGSFMEFFQKPDAGREEGLFRHVCYETDDIEAFAAKVRAYGISGIAIKRGRTDKCCNSSSTTPTGPRSRSSSTTLQLGSRPYTRVIDDLARPSNQAPISAHQEGFSLAKVLVIGGGPGGCASSHFMTNLGHDVTLIERAPVLGGSCRTFYWGGHPYNYGPRHFLTRHREGLGLFQQVLPDEALRGPRVPDLHRARQFVLSLPDPSRRSGRDAGRRKDPAGTCGRCRAPRARAISRSTG